MIRIARVAFVAWFFAAALAGRAGASPGDAAAGSTVDGAGRFTLAVSGLPDSLVATELPGNALQRLWDRSELEILAARLRDRLAVAGRYDATLRLALVEGSGTTPGSATLSVVYGAASGAASPASSVAPASRAVAVVRQTGGAGLPDLARDFERGSKGAATPGAIAAGLAAIRDEAVALGYYGASVVVDSVAVVSGETLVHVTFSPGPPTQIEAIELPGATATRPGAAAAISGLKTGRVVTPALLADGRERLIGSGLFASVGDPRILSGKEPGRARVLIPVEENTTSQFEGAIGVAKGGGVTGLMDLGLGNIAGTGRSAGARWAGLGDGRSTYALRYREPALLGKPIDASFALDGDVADSLFTQTRWALGFGGRPIARSHAALGLAHTGSTYSGYGRGSSETWSMEGQLDWQGLAPQLAPTRGISASLKAEAGHRTERYPGLPEAKRPLLHGAASLEAARSLGGPRVLYGAVRAEQVSLGGGDFPAEELLYLGGSEGLRGHRDRAFAGNRIFDLNLEQRWLTDARGGRAYLFVDAARHTLDAPLSSGVIAAPGASTTLARTELSGGWELGYGAGIRTPVAAGVAGLELGLSPGAALREATIHVHYASHW